MNTPAALNEAFASGNTAGVIAEALKGEGCSSVLDIGCGGGGLARALEKRGLAVTGVDPSETAIEAARRTAPAGTFHVAPAQALPIGDRAFDGAVFLNSLHHVSEPDMPAALAEAARAVRPAGPVVIVEPLAEGPYHEVMRIVDDETEIRAAAARAVADAVRDGRLELRGNVVYERREKIADVSTLIERISAAEPERRPLAEERREELARLLDEHGVVEGETRILTQPLRAYLLRVPA